MPYAMDVHSLKINKLFDCIILKIYIYLPASYICKKVYNVYTNSGAAAIKIKI